MLKKISIIIFLIQLGSITFSQKKNVIINGVVKGCLDGNKIYIYNAKMNFRDSSIIKNEQFNFLLNTELPITYNFYTNKNIEKKLPYTPYTAYIAKEGNLQLISNNFDDWTTNVTIKGNENSELFQQYETEIKLSEQKLLAQLKDMFNGTIPKKNDSNFKKYYYLYDSLNAFSRRNIIMSFVENYSVYIVSSYILDRYGRFYLSEAQLKSTFLKLSDSVKLTKNALNLADYIKGVESSKLGNVLPNFTLPNEKNKNISLSKFKNKYLLIDLWASWCGPCIMAFPTMNKLYEKYHKKGFEILSITIDEQKSNWLLALKKHLNPWPQLFDNKEVARSIFGMSAIPYLILLDTDGKIIAKQIGYDPNKESEIETKLNIIFKE